MAWNDDDDNGSPWKKQEPPDIDAILKKIKEQFKNSGYTGAIVAGIVVIGLFAFSCFFSVQADEVGVVQRFGKYSRIVNPGLNFKWPAGIEKVTLVKEQKVYEEEFGARTLRAAVRTQYAPSTQFLNESLMLTGDLNGALVPWIVQYKIGNPANYLFKVKDVTSTLRDLSEAVMRQVVGDRTIDEVISERREIATTAEKNLQQALNDAETGISLVNLELKRTTVPAPVQPSFNEVNQAQQEKERMIYEAREAYNKIIPEAKGEAERNIKNAEGYALERINRSRGDANRFLMQWKEYSKAKDVTRRRLYLETMGEVIPKLGTKYILDPEQSGLLPLLNLGENGGKK